MGEAAQLEAAMVVLTKHNLLGEWAEALQRASSGAGAGAGAGTGAGGASKGSSKHKTVKMKPKLKFNGVPGPKKRVRDASPGASAPSKKQLHAAIKVLAAAGPVV